MSYDEALSRLKKIWQDLKDRGWRRENGVWRKGPRYRQWFQAAFIEDLYTENKLVSIMDGLVANRFKVS